ncbi:MAG: tRNA 4-thiouridine(8) synthase ThiI [Clostridia bacterium]|nr:tRNA 4-thiouridine(8) synthase ThiI [Clostridia bacterium]
MTFQTENEYNNIGEIHEPGCSSESNGSAGKNGKYLPERIILCRIGEIALKGLNRSTFEKNLSRNMRDRLKACGNPDVHWAQSRFYVVPKSADFDYGKAVKAVSEIFGIVSSSVALRSVSEFDAFAEIAKRAVREKLAEIGKTGIPGSVKFKVETRRGVKTFPMNSLEISCELGAVLLDEFPELTVDVNEPDFILYCEVREETYVYTDIIKAQGGMPIGSNGKACLLLSGGIDSPVAGYMVSKRGVKICAVHFFSYPYTSERAKEKVLELAKILSAYCGEIKVMIVPYTEVQLEIHAKCRDELGTVIMRRSMMRIAEELARRNGCAALVTGESIGQVASQTMQAMYCTDAAAGMPVFRPLIAMDKVDVIAVAREIGTFETSILPYEDCCTVFTPRHPKTRPSLEEVLAEEKRYDYETLEKAAVEGVEVVTVG